MNCLRPSRPNPHHLGPLSTGSRTTTFSAVPPPTTRYSPTEVTVQPPLTVAWRQICVSYHRGVHRYLFRGCTDVDIAGPAVITSNNITILHWELTLVSFKLAVPFLLLANVPPGSGDSKLADQS